MTNTRYGIALWCLCAAAPVLAGRADAGAWKVGTSMRMEGDCSPERFQQLKQAGIDAVELGLSRVDTPAAAAEFGRLSRQVREWADAAGVRIWSVHIPFGKGLDISETDEEKRQAAVRRISELLDVYAPLRPAVLTLHPSAEITKPIPSAERLARIAACRKSLAALARKAAEMKAQIGLECLPRACLGNTSGELLTLVRNIRNVRICMDTNHALQEKTEDFIRKAGSRIVTIHVADYDGKDEKHWLPGKGVNNWPKIVEALEDAGYTGPFLFECAGTPEEKVTVWKQMREAAMRR